MNIIYNISFIILSSFAGCSIPAYLTPDELTKYIADTDNGLTKKHETEGYLIEVAYKPTDLLIQQEIEDEYFEMNQVNSLRNKYASYYFTVNLSRKDKDVLLQLEGGQNQYSELIQILSFHMDRYVNLTTSTNDTIPTGDFILNRTYGLSNATSLLFVFDKAKAKNREWIQFNLNEFGLGIGNQRFRFKIKDIGRTPKLKFNFIIEPNV